MERVVLGAAGQVPVSAETMAYAPGDPELDAQYGTLIEVNWPRLVALCMSKGHCAATADDIVAEAFLQLHLRRDQVRNKAAYLTTTVVNRLKQPGREEPRAEVEPGERSPDPQQVLLEAEMVQAALGQLRGQQRDVFTLFLVGHTPEEISVMLGMVPGTVRSNLRHARKRLQHWHRTQWVEGGRR